MWQVEQVGTNMSAVLSFAGSAFRFSTDRWALKSTPCFDSW